LKYCKLGKKDVVQISSDENDAAGDKNGDDPDDDGDDPDDDGESSDDDSDDEMKIGCQTEKRLNPNIILVQQRAYVSEVDLDKAFSKNTPTFVSFPKSSKLTRAETAELKVRHICAVCSSSLNLFSRKCLTDRRPT
jgi:hypothetical protein